MYKIKIKTKFNTIELIVDNPNSEKMKELYLQPYVEEVYIETLEHYKTLTKKLGGNNAKEER